MKFHKTYIELSRNFRHYFENLKFNITKRYSKSQDGPAIICPTLQRGICLLPSPIWTWPPPFRCSRQKLPRWKKAFAHPRHHQCQQLPATTTNDASNCQQSPPEQCQKPPPSKAQRQRQKPKLAKSSRQISQARATGPAQHLAPSRPHLSL